MNLQPSIFISHGTIYEAFKNEQLKSDFETLRKRHLPITPSAIVLFSGHWQTEIISITTSENLAQMNEGFPSEFQTNQIRKGEPDLAKRMLEMLNSNVIKAKGDPYHGIDHGALIPLMLLFPNDSIPVVQISQQYSLDPSYHKRLAEILNPLRTENILFIGSGGLVHNRDEIVRFAGQELEPDSWAKEFDDYVSHQLLNATNESFVNKIISTYQHPLFIKSHPTSEHFLPLVFASAFSGTPEKIYEAFQWKNLSMSAFKFA